MGTWPFFLFCSHNVKGTTGTVLFWSLSLMNNIPLINPLHHNRNLYIAIQSFVVSKMFFKEINIFIPQGCIKLIKSVSNDMFKVKKDFYFK